jgi:preprotein translocase SecE subunit
VARNRQRAKQRQAERRARRLEQQGGGPPARQARRAEPVEGVIDDPTTVEPSPAVDPGLAVGAPPQDLGRSDEVLEHGPAIEEELEQEETVEALEADPQGATVGAEDGEVGEPERAADGYAPRGRRGRDEAALTERPRFVQFLVAVWAELQRVQWPNRQALTTLTGVVLGFVLIAGGYLGLLDAIFSKLIQAIL